MTLQDVCRASPCPVSCSYPEPALSAGSSRANALREQSCTLCLRLVVAPDSYRAFTGLLKTAFPTSARIQTGISGPNTLAFAMKDIKSLQLLSQL